MTDTSGTGETLAGRQYLVTVSGESFVYADENGPTAPAVTRDQDAELSQYLDDQGQLPLLIEQGKGVVVFPTRAGRMRAILDSRGEVTGVDDRKVPVASLVFGDEIQIDIGQDSTTVRLTNRTDRS